LRQYSHFHCLLWFCVFCLTVSCLCMFVFMCTCGFVNWLRVVKVHHSNYYYYYYYHYHYHHHHRVNTPSRNSVLCPLNSSIPSFPEDSWGKLEHWKCYCINRLESGNDHSFRRIFNGRSAGVLFCRNHCLCMVLKLSRLHCKFAVAIRTYEGVPIHMNQEIWHKTGTVRIA
jgi:hypothetical protein